MKFMKIEKKDWEKGIQAIQSKYKVFCPVKENDVYEFKQIENTTTYPDTENSDFKNTRLSPKSIVFPQSETMFQYSLDQTSKDCSIMKEAEKDFSPRAVIGIRPCDAKAVNMTKLNFDTEDCKDPYWLKLYEATTFVGTACMQPPYQTCFCTSVGSGPFNEEGLDVLLVEEKDFFGAKPLTDKGREFLKIAGWDQKDIELDIKAKKESAEQKIASKIETDKLKQQEILDLYEADFWEDISFSCLNCGTCTYLCPTCWCFDITDQTKGKKGKRIRDWDSCMFPMFTVHTSGHNPRGTKLHRVRQRFMHKLKYFVDKYGIGPMCTGCGRCIRNCPVNIDIRKVCSLMNGYQK